MRFIVLRTVTDGLRIQIESLVGLTQKASGFKAEWVKFEEASTNCLEPEKCDLLSFDEEEREELEQNLETWGFDETVAIIGVEVSTNTDTFVDNEPAKS